MKRNLSLTALIAVALCLAGTAFAAGFDPHATSHALSASLTDASIGLAFGGVTSAAVRALQGAKAGIVEAMKSLNTKANTENRDFTAEEQAAYDKHKADITGLDGRIARQQELDAADAGLAATAAAAGAGTVEVGAAAHIQVEHNADKDKNRGFKSLGDFAKSVRNAQIATKTGQGAVDPRLIPLSPSAAAPTTVGAESSGADGGFLIPVGFSTTLWQLSLEDQALLPMTDRLPVEGNSMSLPKDETTPWGSNGVRAYWQGEAAAGTPTKPVYGRMELKLKKLMALVPISDELLADATALGGYLQPAMSRSIRWKTDEAILFGNGAGVPWGGFAVGGQSFVTVSKESGQATGTLKAENLAKMIARLPAGSYGRAQWLINNDVLPALFTMQLGNYPIYLPAGAPVGGIQGSPYGALLGRPIIVTQHAKSFSSLGDVMLVDLSYYQSIEKSGGIEVATSMHLYFDADAMAFRATFRVDGQPKISAPIDPANGSTTLSPFLQLEAR